MGDAVAGRCVGGPFDGVDVMVRSAGGFLAVDKAAGLAWMYARRPDGRFGVCTEHDDSLIYPEGMQTGVRRLDKARVWDAGVESKLDIVAVDSVGG